MIRRDHEKRVADEPEWDRAADLAAAYGTTLDHAVEAIRRALNDPAPPSPAYGFIVDFRWWERPHRLWARHATRRAAEALGFLR
jgi:hypothetical protein